ncbi:MAG: hypothetical protein PVI69_12630 [Desulfobacterales bacterium]
MLSTRTPLNLYENRKSRLTTSNGSSVWVFERVDVLPYDRIQTGVAVTAAEPFRAKIQPNFPTGQENGFFQQQI